MCVFFWILKFWRFYQSIFFFADNSMQCHIRHGSVTCRPPLTAQQKGTTPVICIRSHLLIHCSCPTCHSASWCIMCVCVWVNVSSSAVLSALCRVSVLMCLWMWLTFPFCLSLAHSFARCRPVCWSGAVYLAEFALISCTTEGYWIPNCCTVMWRPARLTEEWICEYIRTGSQMILKSDADEF